MGSVSELYPAGVERIGDAPYPLIDALQLATAVLGWRKDLDNNEVPPRSIWLDNDKLEAWFKDVQRQRDAKFGKDGGEGSGPIEDPVQNDAAKSLIVG